MNSYPYSHFIIEAFKITLFCVFITGIFKLAGFSNNTLLIVFNMAVMSAAATFTPNKKEIKHILLGSTVMVLSIVLGGLAGFYTPILAKIVTIIYAGLAFLLPKTKIKINIFITSAVMFLIFSSLPFDFMHALKYFMSSLIVIGFFILLTWLFNLRAGNLMPSTKNERSIGNNVNALIVVMSLLLAWLISCLLKQYSPITHLYWISLTIMVVTQSAQQKHITIAIKRIVVNLCGAIIIVVLFNYVIPANFWINLLLLTIFLFLIFALGFSYSLRTLFIELFVLGFTHLLGAYRDIIAVDRVLLTGIGGLLVIITTLLFYYIYKLSVSDSSR